ncbi:TSUP family transporter [Helicobacter saguini]|uniref:Probable membrane transporter protein n=1 Tax=Helicobacter saguini TaxID=1548018 RepID=A0A347VT84_9HELI|nr:sulfite exporter TauE/SafE family protein [Helicobacter saguini]MWV62201.1 TSUP family transporter [Helicobacter saguini]MWV67126.1 TSUP family transporter [Helicobacter saguini]MWV69476.1 TSUP family transporter [Helicobacter saguini]MWV70971.1 TSUP family transporter [Helicobacter saguini]TLD92943.1 sulfite exporter TauE/SafE family protein [Helicobacter saguini]
MEFLTLAFLGVVTGVIAALFGLGGGMIIVPAVLYSHYFLPNLEFSAHDAIAISVLQMIFSSVFGTFLNIFKKKNLDLKIAFFLGLGGLLGASCSGFLLSLVDSKHLTLAFLLVSLATFYKFAFGGKTAARKVQMSANKQAIILILVGALTGVFAISLGIGGGLILTPLLAYFLGFDTKKIMPLSLFFIMFASIAGSLSFSTHGLSSDAVLHAGVVIGSFSILGVLIGSKILDSISLKHHRKLLMGIYIISILATLNKVLEYYGIFK